MMDDGGREEHHFFYGILSLQSTNGAGVVLTLLFHCLSIFFHLNVDIPLLLLLLYIRVASKPQLLTSSLQSFGLIESNSLQVKNLAHFTPSVLLNRRAGLCVLCSLNISPSKSTPFRKCVYTLPSLDSTSSTGWSTDDLVHFSCSSENEPRLPHLMTF